MPQPKTTEKDEKAAEPQSVEDLTQKGAGVTAEEVEVKNPEPVKAMVLSTPEHDVPVATTYVGPGGQHTPPDPKEFDEYGRPRVDK